MIPLPNTTTISSKRQVSIPKAIADAVGLKPGDQLMVSLQRTTGEIIMRPRTGKISDLFGILSHVKIPKGKSFEDLIEDGRTHYLTQKYQRLGFLKKHRKKHRK